MAGSHRLGGADGELVLCDNVRLPTHCRSVLEEYGARNVEDGREVRDRLGFTRAEEDLVESVADMMPPATVSPDSAHDAPVGG